MESLHAHGWSSVGLLHLFRVPEPRQLVERRQPEHLEEPRGRAVPHLAAGRPRPGARPRPARAARAAAAPPRSRCRGPRPPPPCRPAGGTPPPTARRAPAGSAGPPAGRRTAAPAARGTPAAPPARTRRRGADGVRPALAPVPPVQRVDGGLEPPGGEPADRRARDASAVSGGPPTNSIASTSCSGDGGGGAGRAAARGRAAGVSRPVVGGVIRGLAPPARLVGLLSPRLPRCQSPAASPAECRRSGGVGFVRACRIGIPGHCAGGRTPR